MAFPTSIAKSMPGRYERAGIVLSIFPSTKAGLPVELQTATANTTVTSNWGSIILPPSSGAVLRHTANFPNSTKTYYFRARHPASPGFSAGPYTPVVSAKPAMTPAILRSPPIVPTYKGNVEIPARSDVYMTSGKAIRFGTQVTTATLSRIYTAKPTDYVGASSASRFTISTGPGTEALVPTQTAVTYTAYVPFNFPAGAKPNALTVFGIRKGANSTCTIRALLVKPTSIRILTTFTATTNTNGQIGVGTVFSSLTVGSSEQYVLKVTLKSSANTTHSGFYRAQWTYNIPSLSVGF